MFAKEMIACLVNLIEEHGDQWVYDCQMDDVKLIDYEPGDKDIPEGFYINFFY